MTTTIDPTLSRLGLTREQVIQTAQRLRMFDNTPSDTPTPSAEYIPKESHRADPKVRLQILAYLKEHNGTGISSHTIASALGMQHNKMVSHLSHLYRTNAFPIGKRIEKGKALWFYQK